MSDQHPPADPVNWHVSPALLRDSAVGNIFRDTNSLQDAIDHVYESTFAHPPKEHRMKHPTPATNAAAWSEYRLATTPPKEPPMPAPKFNADLAISNAIATGAVRVVHSSSINLLSDYDEYSKPEALARLGSIRDILDKAVALVAALPDIPSSLEHTCEACRAERGE